MPLLIGEADDLRFDGRAVARPDAGDDAIAHGSPVEIVADDLMRFFVGKGQPATFFVAVFPFRQEGKGMTVFIAFLLGHFIGPQGTAVDAGRRTGLEAHELEAGLDQGPRQIFSRALADRAAGIGTGADDDLPFEVGPRRQDDALGFIDFIQFRPDTGDGAVFDEKVCDHELLDVEVVLVFQGLGHGHLVHLLIGLGPEGIDGRSFAGVEHAHLEARLIRIDTHFTAQGVDFPDEMALPRPADSGIAGHEGNII